MNSFIKGLVFILIIGGSSAGIISSIVHEIVEKPEELTSKVSSYVDEASSKVSDFLDSFPMGKGALDIIGAIQRMSSGKSEEVESIKSSVNFPHPKDEHTDLESGLQEISSEHFDFHDILSLLHENVGDVLHDIYNLVMNIISEVNIAEYLSSLLTVQTTEDGELDFKGLAEKYTKTAEEYDVITEDGYILKLFRIRGDGGVVLLTHGLFSSSDDFIIRGNTSLVYMLVQKGHDVWVMNFRGNRYSRSPLNPDTDEEFWDFSLHELGYYDLKAVIDTILEVTEKKKLSVIGHSAGNAAVFVLTSTRPKYNKKIEIFVALSPVCYLSNPGILLETLVSMEPIIDEVLHVTGVKEALGFESFTRNVIQLVCSQGGLGYHLCVNVVLGALSGYHPENLEPEMFQKVLGHFPAGSSTKSLIHFLQIGESGNFAKFDYGNGNMDHYGYKTPPEYDFDRVTAKVVMFAAQNDNVLGIEDVERLRDQLPNLDGYNVVDDMLFTHIDFLYGENAHIVLYPLVLAQLE